MAELFTAVFATRNEVKLNELRALLSDLPVRWLGPAEAGLDLPVVSDEAQTLEERATKRARTACRETFLVSVAEANGLEVAALGGRPGPRSSHYAHERATDAENNASLLRDMEDIDEGERTACIRSVLALASPWDQEIVVVDGVCRGAIARAPRGGGGFGYEPLLVVEGYGDRVLAEIDPAEKLAITPRVRAASALRPPLTRLIDRFLEEVSRSLQ